MLNIKVLKALNGDCIIISYGKKKEHNVLIDGGQGKVCFRQLCRYIDSLKKESNKIDLLVLTHIDSDHIDGILRLLSQRNFDFINVNIKMYIFDHLRMYIFAILPLDRYIFLSDKIFL